MDQQPAAPAQRVCPVCGATSDERARYCWSCGARLPDQPAAFTSSLHDVVPEAPAAAPVPTLAAPELTTPALEAAPTTWPATVDAWPAAPAAASGAAPPRKGVGRTVWIVLGILAGIALFCCVISAVLVIVASRDTAFQHQVSWFASALSGLHGA